MIITSVEFEPCVMPLEDKNWTFALGTASTSRGYIVRLTSDTGHVGYGYSNSSPHMGSTFESLPAELERFKPLVLGNDPPGPRPLAHRREPGQGRHRLRAA
jgi:L-alanine-DL-glutamate epimerase-like enolase superfamily enzyme